MLPQMMIVQVQSHIASHLICLALGASLAGYFWMQVRVLTERCRSYAVQVDDALSEVDRREIEIRRILTDKMYYLRRVAACPAVDPMTRGFDLPRDEVISLTSR